MTPEILPVEEVARILRVSPGRVRDLIRARRIPASKFGRRFYVRHSDLVATVFGDLAPSQAEPGPAFLRRVAP